MSYMRAFLKKKKKKQSIRDWRADSVGEALAGQAGDPVAQLWRAQTCQPESDSSTRLTERVGSQVEDETLSQNSKVEENTTQPRPLTSYRTLTHGPGEVGTGGFPGLAGLRRHPHTERRYQFFPLCSTSW